MQSVLTLAPRVLIFSLAFFSTVAFFTVQNVFALGTEADAMCIPADPTPCPCGTKMDAKGKCTIPNKFGCPCQDSTSGFTTTGTCVATNKCLAKSAQDQHGAGGMPQIPKMPEKGGGGGGDSGSGQSQDPCSSGTGIYGTISGGSAASSTASSTCPQYNYGTDSVSNSISSSIFSPVDTSSFANGLLGSLSGSGSSAATSTAATTTAATPKLDNPSGTFGDVYVDGKMVVTVASTRDAKKNFQVSGFMGIPATSTAGAVKIAQGLCMGRVWLTNFLASIVPASVLDRICITKNIIASSTPKTVGTQTGTGSGSTGTATTNSGSKSIYQSGTIQLGTLPGAPAPAEDTTPQLQIWAVPEKVFRNNKTTVYWSAKNVESCVVRSSDGSEFGTGLKGNRASPLLTRATVYTYECAAKDKKKYTATVGIAVE